MPSPPLGSINPCYDLPCSTTLCVCSITAGMTNPPGNLVLTELPYPNPNPTEALFYGTYLVDWSPPVFTGGLTQLHYNVTVSIFFNGVLVLSTNITSVMIYMRDYVNVRIKVTTIDRIAAQRISEDSPEFHNLSIRNWCAGEGNTSCI